jgi:energy-coupling factor transporter ATP-binding protein EcfA2
MKLVEARVCLYRNIVDSGAVPIDDSITALVGKNESGKTAFLQALYALKPAHPNLAQRAVIQDYPRWRKVRDERDTDLETVAFVLATFVPSEDELKELQLITKCPLPPSTRLRASRTYGGDLTTEILLDEKESVLAIVDGQLNLDETVKAALVKASDFKSLRDNIQQVLIGKDKRTKIAKALEELLRKLNAVEQMAAQGLSKEVQAEVEKLIPTFFYFSSYNALKGRLDLTELLQKSPEQLNEYEQTARALLRFAGVEGKEFMGPDFENRIAELEAAANEISNRVFEYWTQNPDLIVQLYGDSQTINTPQGQTVVHRYVDIRLNDLRHQMTTNFETRSTGFQWFFSFIVAFSEFEGRENVVILLDEPGLGLHARAQADLLRFIEEKLATANQIIYTTHSPFMVNPRRLQRVRLVEDLTSRENPDLGAKVSMDVLSVRPETLFPLQAALGYDLAQNLFVGADNLLVEGPADLSFILVMSEHLATIGRSSLSSRVTIIPVGGADKIPTFIALLGAHLDVTVLVDGNAATNQKIQDLIARGLLKSSRLINIGQVTGRQTDNIEDLFTDDEYLALYNEAFGASIQPGNLVGNDSIVKRIERHIKSKYDHLPPATVLLRRRDTILPTLSPETIERFSRLFELINASLPA